MTLEVEERKLNNSPPTSGVKTEYQLTLDNKFNLVKETIEKIFSNKSFALECTLSVRAELEIKELTQPFSLFLMAPPSAKKKTTVLELTKAAGNFHHSDKFTLRSFVSHIANTAPDKLKNVDLLDFLRN